MRSPTAPTRPHFKPCSDSVNTSANAWASRSSRARVVGGCSAHNACAIVWGSRDDYDEWRPWSFAELEPYLRRAEQELGTRAFTDDELTPWHRALLEGAADVGIPPARRPATTSTQPTAPRRSLLNARGTTRWNTAFAYLDAAPRAAQPDDPRRDARSIASSSSAAQPSASRARAASWTPNASSSAQAPTPRRRSSCGVASAPARSSGGTPSSRSPTSFRSARGSSTIPASASPGRPLRSSST